MQLSKHLSLAEVTRSETAKRLGISNEPTAEHIENGKILAEKMFEPIREHFGVPIFVSSGYRSKALNDATPGSSATSDHSFLRALDLDQDGQNHGVSNNDIFHFVKDNLKFKQLIFEYPENGKASWIHISYDQNNLKNEILICIKENGKPKYLPYKGNEKLIK